jgi:hypothetical protein
MSENKNNDEIEKNPDQVDDVIILKKSDQAENFIRISRPPSSLPPKVPKEKPTNIPPQKKKVSAKGGNNTFSRSPSSSPKKNNKKTVNAKKKPEQNSPEKNDTNSSSITKSNDKTSKKILLGVIGAVAFFIVLGSALLFYKNISDKENARKAEVAAAQEEKRIIEGRRQQRLSDAIKYAQTKPMENEESFQFMLSKFKQIIKVYAGTKYVKKAEQEIVKLEKLKEEKKKAGIENLRKEAEPYIKKGDFNSALTIYKNYPSDFQDQTLKERKKLIDDLTNTILKTSLAKSEAQKQAKINAAKNAKKREDALFNNIATLIFQSKYNDAKKQLEKYSKKGKYDQMLKILTELVAIDADVIKSFKKHIGKEMPLTINGKKTKVKIKKINGNIIQGFNVTSKVSIGIKFNLNDVGVKDRISSLKIKEASVKAIYTAVYAVQKKKYNTAKKYLKKAGPFSTILLKKLSQLKK